MLAVLNILGVLDFMVLENIAITNSDISVHYLATDFMRISDILLTKPLGRSNRVCFKKVTSDLYSWVLHHLFQADLFRLHYVLFIRSNYYSHSRGYVGMIVEILL